MVVDLSPQQIQAMMAGQQQQQMGGGMGAMGMARQAFGGQPMGQMPQGMPQGIPQGMPEQGQQGVQYIDVDPSQMQGMQVTLRSLHLSSVPPPRASLPAAFPAALDCMASLGPRCADGWPADGWPAVLHVTMLLSRNMIAHAILKRSADAEWSEEKREKQNETRKMRWGASFDSLRGNESNSIMIKKFFLPLACATPGLKSIRY